MKRLRRFTALLALLPLLPASSAFAYGSASGTMAVSVTIVNAINLVFTTDASGLSLINTGTSAVTASFGTMSAYGGSVPTGVSRTVNAPSNWQISTPFDVTVNQGNTSSSSYTLTAQLQTADTTNTWAIGGTTLASASTITLTSTGVYATAVPYTFALTIPFSENSTTITNTINFVATAN